MPPRTQPTGDPALKTPARRALRATIKARALREGWGCQMPTCHMPNRAIRWDAPYPNPWSYVLDEIHPRHLGGSPTDPANVRPAHLRCNAIAGAKITATKRRKQARPRPRPAKITITDPRW